MRLDALKSLGRGPVPSPNTRPSQPRGESTSSDGFGESHKSLQPETHFADFSKQHISLKYIMPCLAWQHLSSKGWVKVSSQERMDMASESPCGPRMAQGNGHISYVSWDGLRNCQSRFDEFWCLGQGGYNFWGLNNQIWHNLASATKTNDKISMPRT